MIVPAGYIHRTADYTVHDKCANAHFWPGLLRSVKSYSTVINCANDAEEGPAPPPITFSPFVRTYDLRQWDRSARPFARANAILPSSTANGSCCYPRVLFRRIIHGTQATLCRYMYYDEICRDMHFAQIFEIITN